MIRYQRRRKWQRIQIIPTTKSVLTTAMYQAAHSIGVSDANDDQNFQT